MKILVPRARLELARLAAVDFESTASTDSATEAHQKESKRRRIVKCLFFVVKFFYNNATNFYYFRHPF